MAGEWRTWRRTFLMEEARECSLLASCASWLNITERHARKLVERNAIPYRKVGHLLRFPEAEVDEWCRPIPRSEATSHFQPGEPETENTPLPAEAHCQCCQSR